MSNNVATLAIAAVAIVAVSGLVSRFKRKPVTAKPQYHKLTRDEHAAKMRDGVRRSGASPEYIEMMDLMSRSVDFSETMPLYERVVN